MPVRVERTARAARLSSRHNDRKENDMILVLSSNEDAHANMVLQRLAQLGHPATLVNLAEFPVHVRLSIGYSPGAPADHHLFRRDGTDLPLASCGVVWWRRPQPFQIHAEITDPAYREFAYSECYEAMNGLWLAVDAFWINNPSRDADAAHKVYQLQVAQSVGLEIPTTQITNDPQQARAFVEARGAERTVYKSFLATEQNWRETRVLKTHELDLLDAVRLAPVIFQEYISAQVDLRVTVIDRHIFAAAIHSQDTSYRVDYRMEMDRAQVEAHELPSEVVERLHAFMDRLGLVYGAIDMRLTPDGRYVFLEVNPAGQWLFVEDRTGQPITETFVQLLVERDQ
jgi:hypothetical protein